MIGAASAADLIVKAPVVAPVPVFSWTGVYIGIGGGSGWGTKEYSWNQDATIAALNQQGYPFFPPPLGSFGNTQGSHPISGGFFGGQIGGNWQIGWAVLGVQADAHWADINGKGSCFDPARVSAPPLSASATIAAPRYRASAASRAASAPRSTARSSMPRADGPGSKASSI